MYSSAYVWARVLSYMESRLTGEIVSAWFDDAEVVELTEKRLVLYTPTAFRRDFIRTRCGDYIRGALAELFDRVPELVVLCEDELESFQNSSGAGDFVDSNPQFTFDTFVVGPSNRFAHAAALAVANKPADSYNPLFIYGPSGLGKTHLLYAIAAQLRKTHPDYNIVYIKGDQFTNELIEAVKKGQNVEFRNKYRGADLFLVDDIQFIAGKQSTQEEFFHTFNHLREAGKQIIMTSDKPPKEIQKLEERLCSRFEGGLIADIQRPDFETRLAILRKKAEFEHIIVSDEILELIAEKIDTNVRELEGSLTRLTAYSTLARRPIDMQLAREALRELFNHSESRRITCDIIQDAVASYYGVSVDDIKSARRSHDVTVPRQIAMYLSREMLGLSLTKIGDAFGGRHYTTVMSSIEKVEDSIKQSPSLASLLDDIRRIIKDTK